ncbi:MAG TPA: ATP-binding cassette domain-containing protein [Fimbriimonadales bacterium]|jgi:sodium transport system ATP-binding protein|nr:ATP-binding cassette domain-containing protein [Fimbriimonadales bacterium]
MIVVSDIVKHFQDAKRGVVRAVDGVSFECCPGEIFGLLGANGAGKTTLMRLLSTVISPTSGTATIAGHDIVHEPEKVRQSIGFMSTTTALYTRLTPREMITYMGRLYGLRGKDLERRVDEVIEMLQITEFQDRLCDKLSTGQKQRVSLARTILHDPPVLFFDEPTAGLDVLASRTIMEFIEERKQSGKTVVFCTHIMSEAESLCDRICVLHAGKVAAIGTFEDLKRLTGEERLEKVFLSLVEETPVLAR